MVPLTLCKTAMILAAGLGMRLRPLTAHTPKPLIHVGEKPLLAYHLERLKNLGFEHVVINTHYLSSHIHDYLEKHSPLPYTLSFEPVLLGTGGGIANVIHHFDKPFLVVNSDAFTISEDAGLSSFLSSWDKEKMEALLLFTPHAMTKGFSDAPDFFSQNEYPPLDTPASERLHYSGIQILSPACFQRHKIQGSIFELWEKLLQEKKIRGTIDTHSFWIETGHLEGLQMARDAIKESPPLSRFYG